MTDPTVTDTVAWDDWLRRWDTQQEVYIEDRERRFEVMASVLEALLPPEFLALDLAAGPGSASARILRRFPGSRSVAVDADPVLLRLGRGALGDRGGRLRWIEADLRDPVWVRELGRDSFDAVISTTATHWLTPPELARVYRQLAGLLRSGGVLLNGDLLPLPDRLSRIRGAIRAVDERRQAAALARGSEAWQQWWDVLREEPTLRDTFAERARLWPDGLGTGKRSAGLAFHEAALLEAGFGEVGVVWQDLEERVLLALR